MDKRIIFVNEAFEELTGYTKKELYEENIIHNIHPEHAGKMKELWRNLSEGGRIKDVKYKTIRKDREIRWVLSSWDLVKDAYGNKLGVIGHQREITDKVFFEKRIQEIYKEKFDESNAIHEIVHDIQSPLATITGFIELIEDAPDLPLSKLEQYLKSIKSSSFELKDKCDEILSFYNIEKNL